MKKYSIPTTKVNMFATSYMVMQDVSNGAGLQIASPEQTLEGPQIQ